MPEESSQLPIPTPDLVQSYVPRYDETQAPVDRALAKLFGLFPENTRLEDVLLKVVALNDLYRTNILATYQVAEHIVHLDIDPLLGAGAEEAVGLVAHVQLGGKVRNNYSFATKYCAWHKPDDYPIYDSFVDQMLWGYRKQDAFTVFQRQALWDYCEFKRVMARFREHYHLAAFRLRDIEKFLWLAGKEYYPPAWSQPAESSGPLRQEVEVR